MFKQEDSLNNLKMVWRVAGFFVLVVWVLAMVFSLTIFVLGFPVPEILISPEFMVAGCGFSFLYSSFMYGQREIGGKAELILPVLGLIVGVSILSLGVFVILFTTPNFFTHLCLIIGTALAFFNAKRILVK
jgi:hypothetical protein